MKTTAQKIAEQDAIIRETEVYFSIQDSYFNDRTESNLQKLRVQAQKVKQMIRDSKKIVPTLS